MESSGSGEAKENAGRPGTEPKVGETLYKGTEKVRVVEVTENTVKVATEGGAVTEVKSSDLKRLVKG